MARHTLSTNEEVIIFATKEELLEILAWCCEEQGVGTWATIAYHDLSIDAKRKFMAVKDRAAFILPALSSHEWYEAHLLKDCYMSDRIGILEGLYRGLFVFADAEQAALFKLIWS